MLNKQIYSFALVLKIVTFAAGAVFTFAAPGVLKQDYSRLIEIFSVVSVFTIIASYGSAGNIMRNYTLAKSYGAESFLIYSLLPKKIAVYSLIFFTISYFYEWYIAIAVIIADIGLIGSLILYAEKKYIHKQIYLPAQALLKVLLLFVLKSNFFLFLLIYILVPRVTYIIQVLSKIKEGSKYRNSQIIKHKLVKNENSTYIMLVFFEVYLHSPIVILPLFNGNGSVNNQFAFIYALGMVSYGLISTINELILPTLLANREDKNFHKSYASTGMLIALTYFILTAFAIQFITQLMQIEKIQHTPLVDIYITSTFFFLAYTMNLIRQIYFAQDMQSKWIFIFIMSSFMGFVLFYIVPFAAKEIIILIGLIVVITTFAMLHLQNLKKKKCY